MHACMHFLKIIFLRGELMRITFDVGSYTVLEYMRTIPRKLGKLQCFKEYFDKKLRYIHSANGNSLALEVYIHVCFLKMVVLEKM